jgi:hypothetical protein
MRACHLMLGNQGLCLLDLFLKLELKENVLQHMLKNAMIERKKFRIATLCYSLMWWICEFRGLSCGQLSSEASCSLNFSNAKVCLCSAPD